MENKREKSKRGTVSHSQTSKKKAVVGENGGVGLCCERDLESGLWSIR